MDIALHLTVPSSTACSCNDARVHRLAHVCTNAGRTPHSMRALALPSTVYPLLPSPGLLVHPTRCTHRLVTRAWFMQVTKAFESHATHSR
eukprot:COSAG01_NODE_456_length_16789_cov_58.288556_12_plen_90_part_00